MFCFNISHSHGLALYAITEGREFGVDVERIEPDMVRKTIAEQFFSQRAVDTLRRLPANLQPATFFDCWTRKVAYIKPRGEGLSIPLDQFDVSLIPRATGGITLYAWRSGKCPSLVTARP